jgi:asparagine synthase (glutamine-hydrolysing)
MCGIVGIVGLNGRPVDPAVLQAMNDRQVHRGPDGEGFVLGWPDSGGLKHACLRHTDRWDSRAAVRVGLGHRRLAILDLSDRGLQPMASEDQRTWLVFNGEIYNFQALRRELEASGHVFNSRTDTEVLLHAYLHWGEECLAHLEGMYAFAIWDACRGRLFCARDRLGIKPFYYATPADYFLFASEIKALLPFPGLQAVADDEIVLGFLVHSNCDYGERTAFRDVKALPAAHCLTLDLDSRRLALRRYWHLEPQPANGASDAERIDRLRDLLEETTRRHLVSDVRVGSCLSGGLDSSTVVSLAAKIRREQPKAAASLGDRFQTFTSCFEYREFDERGYALAVARSAAASPSLVFPSPEGFWSEFERMVWYQDMPFAGICYVGWCVMRAAREAGVKVLLDGQGGDEVFGGYAKFRYAYFASLLRSGRVGRLIRELGATLLQGDRYVLNIRGGYRYLPTRVRGLVRADSVLKDVLRADWDQVLSARSTPAARWWRNASAARNGEGPGTPLQRIQIDDILVDTLPQLLRLEDRFSMAFSLESRVPLLDHKLVEYGLSLPDHLKVSNGWSKFAVRQAMRGLMPEQVRLRKSKLGFAVPDRQWLSRDLRGQITKLLEGGLRCSRYVDTAALRRWYQSALGQTANRESFLGLFRVLSVEMWMRAFGIA